MFLETGFSNYKVTNELWFNDLAVKERSDVCECWDVKLLGWIQSVMA